MLFVTFDFYSPSSLLVDMATQLTCQAIFPDHVSAHALRSNLCRLGIDNVNNSDTLCAGLFGDEEINGSCTLQIYLGRLRFAVSRTPNNKDMCIVNAKFKRLLTQDNKFCQSSIKFLI